MKEYTKRILTWLMTIIIVLFIFINLPNRKIKDATNALFNNIDNFIKNIDNVITIQENLSFDQNIRNITFFIEDDNCFAIFEFRFINPSDVLKIKINNKNYQRDSFSFEKNRLFVNITDLICENDITPLTISKIYTKGQKEYNCTLTTIYHKEINYELIEEKKQSMVGIRAQKSALFNSYSTWGSGIILSKQAIIKSTWRSDYTMYEYLIVTNSHVVENRDVFYIYNNNENDEYPKKTELFQPNETVELLGLYTKDTDLAFLVLTTFEDSLVPLDDEQLINNDFIPINTSDTVFIIGSPIINNKPAFNSYKIGKIKLTSEKINLEDSDLCSSGCESIKTSAYLGNGSSGGGLFDVDGNLIGINFAGNPKTNDEAFAIPLRIVFEALQELWPQTQVKRSHATSFFYLNNFITNFSNLLIN